MSGEAFGIAAEEVFAAWLRVESDGDPDEDGECEKWMALDTSRVASQRETTTGVGAKNF